MYSPTWQNIKSNKINKLHSRTRPSIIRNFIPPFPVPMLAPDLDTCFRYHVEHTVVLLVELAVELDLQSVV